MVHLVRVLPRLRGLTHGTLVVTLHQGLQRGFERSSMSDQHFSFGAFEVDWEAGEVRKHGIRLKLQEQPFQVLALLLRRPGQVVTREELRTQLWSADTFVDFEHGLNSAINKLREALGDSADNPRFVETLPRRGYRFVGTVDSVSAPAPAPHMTRLIVMPFRILRSDPETDFLAFSLPDAIASSLSGLDSLIVRSSIVASRFAGKTQDLKTIAGEAGVDIVLTGTLLRAGEQLRVSTQLVEAPGGTLVWSQTSQLSLGDIFKLQDDLTSRIVESLSLPLTTREHRMLKHDVPASAKAYEFYLRANQLVGNGAWSLARDLYLECLQEDPRYAPAWARLGRVYHFLGKFGETNSDENLKRAEAAIVRALEINPELSMAHNLHARLEIDFGRAQDVMTRLLKRAQARAADPELFAGLVHACRYCGLLDASRAADEQARRIDKLISTSVVHTYFMLGDYQQAHEMFADDPITDALTLMMLGRDQEVVEKLQKAEDMEAVWRRWCDALRLLVEGHRAQGLAAAQTILPPGYRDPETLYYVARLLAHFGDPSTALALLARAVEEGFFCFSALARDPWLNTLRGDPAFTKILRHAEARHREALAAFLQADGDRLLGLKLSR